MGVEGSGGAVEAFVELGTLIVEGRLPAPGTARGYKEGSHCPAAITNQIADHQCDTNNFLCKRAEKLRKHMSLLCSNAVPMCVEVLLCPNCDCGMERAQCPEVANLPSSSDLLLEQWTVYVGNNSNESCGMSVRGLFQAVRSQLHFSQLSAWWSSSKGTVPKNVCYRVTLPGEAFASHFSRPPLEHSFPIAAINSETILKVSVRTLPRCESVPIVTCPVHAAPKSVFENESVQNVRKRFVGPEQSHLGESLLDPPGRRHSDRIMATPGVPRSQLISVWRNGSPPSPPRRRLSRHNIIRLRDNADKKEPVPANNTPVLVDDRMQTNCDRSGKHHCRCEEDSESIAEMPRQRRRSQVTMPLPVATQSSPSQSSVNENRKINFDLSQKEVEEVLTVLRTRSCPSGVQQASGKSVCNEESCGKLLTTTKGQSPLPSASVVGFVSEEVKVPGKAELLLSAILRTSRNADETSPLKRKREHEDDIHKCDFLRTDLSSTTFDMCQINCKKMSPTHLCEEKTDHKSQCSDSVGMNKPCIYDALESTKIVDSVGRNKQTSNFQTKTDSEKSHRNVVCSLVERFRTKNCFKNKQEESTCSGSDKCGGVELDVDLLNGFGNLDLNKSSETSNKSRGVPTALDKAKFRRSLDSAASMVFHWRTGLPLTSSPAPVRRASHHFDFDSSITSVSAIRSALYDSVDNLSGSSEDTESEGSAKSPCSPQLGLHQDSVIWPIHCHPTSSSLLGSFEESVLNGRLEPVSTVQGFTADLGASGSFCPRHLMLPVTVFFYTLGDNDKVSTPYLGHINLGKKGYVVPRSGTIQVTLMNPLGTVIKMFVVMYDLSDMPVNSHTFLRQRTLYMPANTEVPESSQKYLRYLIHLRFCSSKSGRISLHTDIRMIIFRKSDFDTATGHGMDSAYEMRSFTTGPTNPKFSPRK